MNSSNSDVIEDVAVFDLTEGEIIQPLSEASPTGGEEERPGDAAEPSAPTEPTAPTYPGVERDTAEVKALAKAQGWTDPAEWKGTPPPGGFRSAYDYVSRTSQANNALRQQLADLTNDMKAIRQEFSQAKILDAQDEMAELNQQRADAIRSGDVEQVNAIDQRRYDLHQELTATAPAAPAAAAPTADEQVRVQQWVEANPWYNESPELKALVDWVADNRASGTSIDQMLKDCSDVATRYRLAHPETSGSVNGTAPHAPVPNESLSGTENGLTLSEPGQPARDPNTGRFMPQQQTLSMAPEAPVEAAQGQGASPGSRYTLSDLDENSRRLVMSMRQDNPQAYPSDQAAIDGLVQSGYLREV